ncbi:hypothetical protein [Subtercola frigoramans]|uniref:Uncharacterized protein n=1 Tax=Subtercola frigoramans TaxID=120298 RepID=A0ABS2L409_9MICO|nr:hypothetical protein [Subtercola frigoramans]MBM7471196.1 hypothetical protein [Subtercola frigoramans]
MRTFLVGALSGQELIDASASDRSRLRGYYKQLRESDHPDRLLAGWVPQRPVLKLAVAPSDLDDLGQDARIVKSGFSDPRAQIAAAGQLEVRVAAANLASLRRDYLLRPSDRPNVFVHLTDERSPSPLPLGLLLVDLANHDGVRERSRVAELLRDTSV